MPKKQMKTACLLHPCSLRVERIYQAHTCTPTCQQRPAGHGECHQLLRTLSNHSTWGGKAQEDTETLFKAACKIRIRTLKGPST